ncbi:hypothetical protein ANCDUO_15121 [Ancylostoma duodenale]|uniref:Uncharacterized protein n=1 Tax=Ancylostoma duodenale TaxID=51022 RepID=A0A0C2GCH9_9BILA|nr:hypothetical protein ANCDUO_15121 [Ancylostoma duodenale]
MRILSAFFAVLFTFINPCMMYKVILFTLVHLMLTCFSLYGTYSCRPALIRPFLFDAVFSSVLLLFFVCFSVLIYWQLTSSDFLEDKEDAMKLHLRYVQLSLYLISEV